MIYNIKAYDINHTKQIVFSLYDGVYCEDGRLFVASKNIEIDPKSIQMGFGIYDARHVELFIADIVSVDDPKSFGYIDFAPNVGYVIKDIYQTRDIYNLLPGEVMTVASPYLYDTLSRVNKMFRKPKYQYEDFVFGLEDLRLDKETGKIYSVTSLEGFNIDIDLTRVNTILGKNRYAGSSGLYMDKATGKIKKK